VAAGGAGAAADTPDWRADELAGDDPQIPVRVTAFAQTLQELGWTDGRNLRIDYRFAGADASRIRKHAQELAALAPDVFVSKGSSVTNALQQASGTVPIVFVLTSDPVGEGLVASLGRPGGNTTGFALWEYGISVKWLELLKQIAPNVTRAGLTRDRSLTSHAAQFGAMQGVAPSLGMQLTPIDASGVASEIERAIAAFARGPNGGLIVPTGAWAAAYRELIITLASRHRLPAVYPFRYFVTSGGLASYGPDTVDAGHRRRGDPVAVSACCAASSLLAACRLWVEPGPLSQCKAAAGPPRIADSLSPRTRGEARV
jgi:putative tryptophan/tyrosine transport system substrate-binding protein